MKKGETQPKPGQDPQEIETIFLALAESCPGSVFVIDTAGVVLYANETLATKLNRTVGGLTGSCIYDHMPPKVATQRKSRIDEVVASGTPGRLEGIPGDPFNDNEIHPIRDSAGAVTRLVVLDIELTDRKQGKDDLGDYREKYRRLLANIPGLVYLYVLHPDGSFAFPYASSACRELFDIESEDLMRDGTLLSELIHPDDREKRDTSIRQSAETLRPWREVLRHIVHGEVRWYDCMSRPERQPNGDVLWDGIILEITGRKQAEEQLQASEERFRLISENVADLISVLDLEARRVYSSPSYKSILGEPASLSGADFFQQIHPDDRDKVKAVLMEIIRTGVNQRVDHRFVTQDGATRHVESQGSVIRDQQGTITNVVVVSRDVTEKKLLEQQFVRAQRLESLGTLAGGVAHDLNNVLSPLLLAVAALKKRAVDERDRKMLNTLEANVYRGSDIVKQILAFSRGVEGERIPVQVRHLVKDMIHIMGETFPKAISVRSEIPKDIWTVVGDATQIRQLLMNLCVNARDAMPNGGTITLSVENQTIDQQYAQMHLESKVGRYVMLAIKDTGTGMPPAILDRIFDPFFTTKEMGKGTGLGLPTVHSIVKSHGGFVNVYSEVGKGSTFKVHLPAAETTESQTATRQSEELLTGHNELILVVDDEASICEITKKTLEAFGYRAITASDGAEAIALYASRGKEIAMVITDMVMPLMDGPRTIRALRKLNPQAKIIASSGHLTDSQTVPSRDLAVEAIITKPYTAEKLLHVIHQVLSS